MSGRVRAATALVLVLLAGAPVAGQAQVFLASVPHPEFAIGPLFVVANVSPDAGVVTVNLSWSLTMPPRRRAADIRQDFHLLWPAEVAESTAPGPADPALARHLEARGYTVVASGRLLLRSRDRMLLGTGILGEPVDAVVSYATFVRRGPTAMPIGASTYLKIPWTPKLADPLAVLTLPVPLRGLVTPKPATWVEELFWGRRSIITVGFGDVGTLSLPLYPLYFENRERVVRLGRESSMVLVNFADAEHLKIEEIAPAAATRRPSRLRTATEIVALPLAPAEGTTPQTVRVQFSYFTGPVNWRPIVIAAVLLLLGNFTGALMLSKDAIRILRERRRRRLHAGAPATGPSREALSALVPGTTPYEEVLARCGSADEERARPAPQAGRSLIYRRSEDGCEVEVVFENDRVLEVHHRVGRRQDRPA